MGTVMKMRTSPAGRASIQRSEGFVPHVYPDNGVDAIAYGHRLLPGESFPNGISEPEGSALLDRDLETRFEPIVNARIPENCTQGQFDALVDFVYNVKNQPKSLEQLLSHGWDQVPTQILRWCHVEDPVTHEMREDKGLRRRREGEYKMWIAQPNDRPRSNDL